MAEDSRFQSLTHDWMVGSVEHRYSYNFRWLGRPIIQYPQDIVAMQEIIWEVQPDLIVEAGIAHGGSLVFYASILELLGGERSVLGVDVDIRQHNREAIEAHPMFKRIHMIEGSSIDHAIVQQVHAFARDYRRVLVVLDSNHTDAHVRQELESYSPLVKTGSYLVVFDTVIENLPDELSANRPWRQGNNPWTAVQAFLATNDRFVIDDLIEGKLAITVAPSGYLKCVKD